MSDYDPSATGGDQPWGSPQPPPQPTGGWGAPPGAGTPPPGPPYGSQPPPYGASPGGGQQLPPYSQFGSPQQANWGAPQPGTGQLAEWATRAGGIVIDWLIIFVPAVVIDVLWVATNATFFEVLAYLWGFGMWIWWSVQVGQYGSSPGMRLVGLKCVKRDTGQLLGGGLGFVRGLLNWVAFLLCVIPGLVNFLWPLWDAEHQTLSDKIMGTVVIRVPAEGFSVLPKRAA